MADLQTGMTRREEFGALETTRSSETAITAAAAQARAQVEAMYVMALQRPRDIVAVEQRLLGECGRRGFAEAATYTIPRGGKQITGPSIRFAEAALRSLGNVHVSTSITYEDAERRVGTVTVIDLEANVPLSAGFTIDKTVERRKVTPKDTVLGERTNSTGQTVYRIAATEADVLMKQESLVARLRRNLILQLLPGDLRDAALAECATTLRKGDAKDPKETARSLAKYFSAIGISISQLREYLGHNVDQVTPDEAKDLRGIFAALRDEQTTWSEVMESRREAKPPAASPAEQTEKAKLLKEIATMRVQDKARHDAALAAVGVNPTIPIESLSTETLGRIVREFDKPAEPEQPAGDDVDEDPDTAAWLDGTGEREPGEEG